jgi:hypothetical protein
MLDWKFVIRIARLCIFCLLTATGNQLMYVASPYNYLTDDVAFKRCIACAIKIARLVY